MIIPKHHYKLIAIDLNGHKELVADPRAIQQIELIGQLKNEDGKKADETQDVLILMILEKIKETRLQFSQGGLTI